MKLKKKSVFQKALLRKNYNDIKKRVHFKKSRNEKHKLKRRIKCLDAGNVFIESQQREKVPIRENEIVYNLRHKKSRENIKPIKKCQSNSIMRLKFNRQQRNIKKNNRKVISLVQFESFQNSRLYVIRKLQDKLRNNLLQYDTILNYRKIFLTLLESQPKSAKNSSLLKFCNERLMTPNCVYCCCEGLFFNESVNRINVSEVENWRNEVISYNSEYICHTCRGQANSGRIPTLSVNNGLQFPEVPEIIKSLTPLEERMISPILNFMQIVPLLPHALNSQLSLKGSVINIPVNVQDMVKVLPRTNEQMQTIQIKLLRHISHRSHYMYETVRPSVMCKALALACKQELYIKNGIKMNERYYAENINAKDKVVDFIVDENDTIDPALLSSAVNIEDSETFVLDSVGDSEVILLNLNEQLAQESVISMAPGQDKKPLPWLIHPNIDELCFLKIFYAQSFNKNNVSYSKRIKSELRRVDRRACIPARVLYAGKKKQEQEVIDSMFTCLRKVKNCNRVPKAQCLLSADYMDELIHHDDGFRMLKNVRTAPAYWESKKKELFAMIRQLGAPTLFLTLSANELMNPDLLQFLYEKRYGKKISLEDAMRLDKNIVTDLIKNDPVACSLVFEHKVRKFIIMLQKECGIFGKYRVIDYYFRIEFQMRGSPHVHMFLWLENAPKYNKDNPFSRNASVKFIDEFITCSYNEINPYISFQTHKHKPQCYKTKGKNKRCRFNIPFPVFSQTTILDPFEPEEEIHRSKASGDFKCIQAYMEILFKNSKRISFADILNELQLTESEYLLAIRSSLKTSKVFLKRSSLEVGINYYNTDILNVFEANIDIQFILNEYAVASYIINYINKAESGLSKLLHEAVNDVNNGNYDLKAKLRRIANVFINSKVMSAQEAVYICLSLPLSKSSRDSIFINTGTIIVIIYIYMKY